MAATLTNAGELTYLSFPIIKTETTADGDLLVWGKATDGSVDSDEQIVDPEWAAKAVKDWLATGGNLRVQHNAQRDPAGIGIESETDADGAQWVKSLVVEPVAKRLVEKGVLQAYSVGIARPKIVRDAVARGGRIVDGSLVELSLVDRPANKNCGIQLVKSAADGHPEWVGKVFGQDALTKAAAPSAADPVSVELPADVSVSFSPADLAKLLDHRRVAEERVAKRDMDPDTGGGVDRDTIAEQDFAGKDRSFPIVTPGDVADAADSIGRAGADNFSADELKANIIRIAKRKGADFVAQLPQKWRDETEGTKATDADAAKKKKPFAGAKEPFGGEDADGKDTDGDGHDMDESAKPDTTKGLKDCAGCGKSYHADSKMKRCEGCGKKLPKADKAISVTLDLRGSTSLTDQDLQALIDKVGKGLGANVAARREEPAVDTTIKGAEPTAAKGEDRACLGCGKSMGEDDKFCSDCGKANPGFESKGASDSHAAKGKPSPGAGVTGEHTVPVPAHREPDGPAIEALEHDAQMPTIPDAEMKTATRFKTLAVPAPLGVLHDLLCAGYHPADTTKCHPGAQVTDLDVDQWQAKALLAATGAPLAEAARAAQMWQHAVTLKGTDDAVIAEIREEAHKAFQDANPGPGTFPQPSELSATRFRRPYLAAGHANPGTGHGAPNTAPVPAGHMSADGYDRDYLSAGHAAASPGNKGAAVIGAAPMPVGMGRTHYTNAQRTSARTAMAAMHDHIAQTFPDLCPMNGPGSGGEVPTGARPVPTPASMGKAENTGAARHNAAKRLRKLTKSINAARAELGMDPIDQGVPAPAALAKAAAVADPTAELLASMRADFTEKLDTITKALSEERAGRAQLQATVDALGDLPDPATAPFKGVAYQTTATKTAGRPAGARTVAETAEQTQMAMMRAMQDQARNSPNPGDREAAWAQLYKMNGLPTTP